MDERGSPQAVLLNDTSISNHHGCKIVVEQIFRCAAAQGIQITHTVKVREDWREARHADRILGSDMVIVNAEGTLHHADSRPRAAILALCAPFCREHGIIPVMINSVYQANDSRIAEHVRSFERVFVRESNSQRELARDGIQSRVVPDMTFAFRHSFHKQQISDGPIVFSDCVLAQATERLHALCRHTRGAEFITLQADPVHRTRMQALRFLPKRAAVACVGSRVPASWRREAILSGSHRSNSRADLLTIIDNARFIVTGRFHLVCLAMLARTPFVAVPSNTFKIEGLLQDAGLAHRLLTVDDLTRDVVLGFAQWDGDELDRVERYVREARDSIEGMFTEIRELVDATPR